MKIEPVIPNRDIIQLWKLWNSLRFTKIISVDQLKENNIIIEFCVNVNSIHYKKFIDNVSDCVLNKTPQGTISFTGYLPQKQTNQVVNNSFLNSQYKQYKIEFINSASKDELKIDRAQEIILFYDKIIEILGNYASERSAKGNKKRV